MTSMRKAIGGSIHRIREFELEKVNLIDEFDILQIVGEGWFGKILLTEHRSTQTEMVLKALPKPYTSISDFYREFHYGLHLSAHRNIITTYDVAFETAGFFVFSQEYAPLGDLTSNVTETGLGELHSKRVARQLAAAVQHIHSRELVHRDIKLDNILVFKSDFSRIKLCDFGETRKVNSVVRRHNEWLPYSPPEVLQIDTDEAYKALTAHDVWQFGIVIFVCLTGCLPWQKAAMDDPRYVRYQNWHLATLNIAKKPKLFQLISSKAQRMFKRLLDPRHEKRPISVFEVNKYLDDRWLAKLGAEKALNGGADDRDELCPSMYSFHSSLEEKNQLLFTLTQYGIETTVDRSKKKDRIREWIQSSAIAEENEDESDEVSEILGKDYEEDDYSEKGELNMQGKHFPERRESTKALSDKQKRSKKPKQPAPKNLERKNPFAPKVAEERRVIAQSANFPNGDRNLGIKLVSSDKFALPQVTDLQNPGRQISVPLNNLQNLEKNSRQSPSRSARVVKTTSAKPLENTMDVGPNNLKVMNLKNAVDSNNRNSKGLKAGIRGAEVPPVILGPAADGNRTNSVQNRGGGTTSTSSPQDPLSNFAGSGGAILGNGGGGHLREPLKMESAYKPTSPPVPMRKHRSQTATLPVLPSTEIPSKHQQPRRSLTTVLPVGPTQTGPIQPISPLTMSVASQLVMQSFNSLQAMNVALPVVQNDESRQTKMVPAEVKEERSMIEKEPDRKYGKDAYEHYGIATRVIGDIARPRGSMSSDSRSASN